MTHLIKIPLQNADMFVEALPEGSITYSIRHKETGILLEPVKTSKIEADDAAGVVRFDNRYISIQFFAYMVEILQ